MRAWRIADSTARDAAPDVSKSPSLGRCGLHRFDCAHGRKVRDASEAWSQVALVL